MSRKANMRIPLLVLLIWLIGMLACVAFGSFDAERRALLDFKTGLNDPGNLLCSWHGKNCCDWWGVACDKSTGHVVKLNLVRNPYKSFYNSSYYSLSGKIDPSLLNLRQLTHLHLSGHDFSSTSIPGFIGSFENLIYLNVSWSMFSGVIPYQLGNLSKLRYLDLSHSCFSGTIPTQLGNLSNLHFLNLGFAYDDSVVEQISWVSRLSSLRYLDMSGNNITEIVDWSEIKKMSYLETLILSSCGLGNIPSVLSPVNFTSLQRLDLSYNPFDTTLPSWFWNLTNLSYLDLRYSEFHGGIPDGLSNLDSLIYLHLGGNNFKPISFEPFKKLCNLRDIGLYYLNIGGNIADVVKRLSCRWYNLESVGLGGNNLEGNISSWIAEMRNLSVLDLSDNVLSGPLSPEMGTLTNLIFLDLSQNSLSGVITEAHFINVSKLKELYLHNNLLNMEVSDKWIPPFQLNGVMLTSCRLGPQFPSWLRWQAQLYMLTFSNTSIDVIPDWFRNLPLKYLDLSYNNIDVIPNWFWNLPLIFLDLSYNNIRGNLPLSLQFSSIYFLSLRSNDFEGPFPNLPVDIMALDLSNNNLSGPFPTKMEMPWIESLFLSNNRINGSIPSCICGTQYLFQLSLSNNTLSGAIPSCWNNSISLNMMDLSNNNLTGELPASIGMLTNLETLQLDNNKLYGEIPSTLQQCKDLTFLGLGRNNFSGKIPAWIGESLQSLEIIQLRSNIFSGYIPPELGQLARLQILDLAHNNLMGSIPYSFGNFSAMRNTSQYFHSEYEMLRIIGKGTGVTISIELFEGIKGESIYSFKPLDHAKSIDLSGNNLSGHIPIEIGSLKDLITLNLSQNHLIGRIPESIGNIQFLESLDLSFNKFSGPIPMSLSDLFMLNHLNLSYNNLSGKIPSGRQLDTLIDPSIYTGNTYICGPPTNKTCSEDKGITIDGGTVNNRYVMIWLYYSIGLGFIFGFWGIFGVLIFRKTWRISYFQMLDKSFDDIYVKFVLVMRRLTHVRGYNRYI